MSLILSRYPPEDLPRFKSVLIGQKEFEKFCVSLWTIFVFLVGIKGFYQVNYFYLKKWNIYQFFLWPSLQFMLYLSKLNKRRLLVMLQQTEIQTNRKNHLINCLVMGQYGMTGMEWDWISGTDMALITGITGTVTFGKLLFFPLLHWTVLPAKSTNKILFNTL